MPSASISIPMQSLDSSDPVMTNEHVLRSGQLGMQNAWPREEFVHKWKKFFLCSCLFALFLDPLFFFVLHVNQDDKCIEYHETMKTVLIVLRTLSDSSYVFHMILQILQFRLACAAPESDDDLVDSYLFEDILIDILNFLPLPQIFIWLVLDKLQVSSGANLAKILLLFAIILQYAPRLYRIVPMIIGRSERGFIFESGWANFNVNLVTFALSGHLVGSCWYIFGLERVNRCLRDACVDLSCIKYTDCNAYNKSDVGWQNWRNNTNASACFGEGHFQYGIYQNAVNVTTNSDVKTKYIYSLFWGLQQISTLAGNQTPSHFNGEVVFTIAIIGLGLFIFALLIGNMQNFLQALGHRRLQMYLRGRDVKQWMRHRRLPLELRRQIRESERFNWTATRGVNEIMLLENLPEDLQGDIRRHLFKFVKNVRIFSQMDEPILDAMRERLIQKTYIKGSKILVRGGLIDKMVFIVQGKVESIGKDKNKVTLCEGDVCGEELITWCLEHSSVNRGHRLLSNREAICVTNVEAFALRAADLEDVFSLRACIAYITFQLLF